MEFRDYEKLTFYYNISRISKEEIISNQSASTRIHLYSATLSVSDRMLCYLISYIFLPKHSNHLQLSDLDLQLTYAIKKKLKVNWVYLIMFNMLQQKSLQVGFHMVNQFQRYFNIVTFH